MQAELSAPLVTDLPPRTTTGRAPVIAVVAEKGGVGKTTVASNIAAALGKSTPARPDGLRVLAIDAEPQGQLAIALGATVNAETQEREGTLADAYECAEYDQPEVTADNPRPIATAFPHFDRHFAEQPLTPTLCENVVVLTGDEDLVEARDQINGGGAAGEQWLRTICRYFSQYFDVIVIDTPPSVSGPLMLGALFAADLAVTSVHANQGFSIRSLDKLATHVGQLGEDAPPLVPVATAVEKRLLTWREINEAVSAEGQGDGYLAEATELAETVLEPKHRKGPWLALVPQDKTVKNTLTSGEPIVVGRRSGSIAGLALRRVADAAYTLAVREVETAR